MESNEDAHAIYRTVSTRPFDGGIRLPSINPFPKNSTKSSHILKLVAKWFSIRFKRKMLLCASCEAILRIYYLKWPLSSSSQIFLHRCIDNQYSEIRTLLIQSQVRFPITKLRVTSMFRFGNYFLCLNKLLLLKEPS